MSVRVRAGMRELPPGAVQGGEWLLSEALCKAQRDHDRDVDDDGDSVSEHAGKEQAQA